MSHSESSYVAVKVCVKTSLLRGGVSTEYKAYEHLTTIKSSHNGQAFIRDLYDTFEIEQADGSHHHCFVLAPMHTSLSGFKKYFKNLGGLSEELLRATLKCVLQALDFLHTEANMTHCGTVAFSTLSIVVSLTCRVVADVNANNIMLSIRDEDIFEDLEKEEKEDPSPRKVIDDKRTIYASRKFRHPDKRAWGMPVLCDLGEARVGTLIPMSLSSLSNIGLLRFSWRQIGLIVWISGVLAVWLGTFSETIISLEIMNRSISQMHMWPRWLHILGHLRLNFSDEVHVRQYSSRMMVRAL